MLGLDRLELDGDLFARDDVDAEVDVSEGAGADLLADAVLKVKRRVRVCVADGYSDIVCDLLCSRERVVGERRREGAVLMVSLAIY